MANRVLRSSIISVIILMSFIPLVIMANFLPNPNQRDLQYVEYSSSGVYYELTFPKNSITGTGDKLQDVPYKALCVIKTCSSNCCTGDINNMQCASAEDCKIYFDSTRKGNVAAAVIIPIAVTAIFLTVFLVLLLKFKLNGWLAALIGFICMFVITIPFIIWYLVKNKPFSVSEKASDGNVKGDSLNSNKNNELKNEADKIILCDNKKNSDLSNNNKANSSNKEYNKLSVDEESNRNVNIISVSNKQENGQRRENMPDIVFDDNLKEERSRHTASNRGENSYNKQKSNNYNDEIIENNQYNNSVGNVDEDNKDLLEKSHVSDAKRSENNVSGYNRQESNANRSVKSANKSSNNVAEETPEGAEENNHGEKAEDEQPKDAENNNEEGTAGENNNENPEGEAKEENPAEDNNENAGAHPDENIEPEVQPVGADDD